MYPGKILFHLSLILLISLSVATSGQCRSYAQLEEELVRLEDTLETYFAEDRITAWKDYNGRVDRFSDRVEGTNSSVRKHNSLLEARRAELDELDNTLRNMNRQLEETRHTRDIPRYNRLAKKYNELAQQQRRLVHEYNRMVSSSQDKMQIHRGRLAERQEELIKEQERLQRIDNFFRTEQHLRFNREVNSYYMSLVDHRHSLHRPWFLEAVERVRRIRRSLAEYTIRESELSGTSMVYVEALINGEEPVFFLVDTGASEVTLTPEIVSVLGIEDSVGETAKHTLAGGVRIEAPKIILASLSCLGHEKRKVSASVLDHETVGIDGLLGRSFLKYFTMQISGGERPKLALIRER